VAWYIEKTKQEDYEQKKGRGVEELVKPLEELVRETRLIQFIKRKIRGEEGTRKGGLVAGRINKEHRKN